MAYKVHTQRRAEAVKVRMVSDGQICRCGHCGPLLKAFRAKRATLSHASDDSDYYLIRNAVWTRDHPNVAGYHNGRIYRQWGWVIVRQPLPETVGGKTT